ncbi:hypothetical protein [Luteimonas sp. 3794]|uniref:hypothetical protein n=1 Tax=Luteimonas sp. 3794 TaxID=2817730 RepID=UPI0028542E2D|nr:hypothetical protein [Luteimonas sp. 3794]MDR6990642.1 hypothetical protein [Luteimonas sp. 3794]
MQCISSPLDDTDRATLHVVLRRERHYAFMHLLGAFGAAAPAIVVAFLDTGLPLALTVAAVATGVCAWQLRRFFHWRTTSARLRRALAMGMKSTTQGALSGVEVVQPGHLRYRVDGDVLILRPLAAPLEQADTAAHMHVTRFEHVPATDVVLHWVPLTARRGALLGVEYSALPAPERVEVTMDAAAVERSGWQVRQLAILLSVGLLVVILISITNYGFGLHQLLQTLGIAAGAGAVIFACNRVRVRRLLRGGTQMTVVRGVVSEVLSARVRAGRRTLHHTWYRVGNMLVCPPTSMRGAIGVGSPVTLEYIASDAPGLAGTLVSLSARA